MTLILVQKDSEWVCVTRRGRFALERAAADSPIHRDAAIKTALDRFIPQMVAEGFVFHSLVLDNSPFLSVDPVSPYYRKPNPNHGKPQFEVLEHIIVSEDMTPDVGTVKVPPPPPKGSSREQMRNYRDVCATYEQYERARVAWDATDICDMVDFRVFVRFKMRTQPSYRVAQPLAHTRRSQNGTPGLIRRPSGLVIPAGVVTS